MSDLFDADEASPKPERRVKRSVPEKAAASDAVAPAAEEDSAERIGDEAMAISDHDARNAMQIELMTKGTKPPRLLDDAARERLSKIVDYRISAYKRHKVDAHEIRQVLLEVIANL